MEKYNKKDLIKYINENLSTDEIGKIYGVSGRTIRYWFKKEGLESNVKNSGWQNLKDPETKKKAIRNSKKYFKNKDKKVVKCNCEICNSEYTVKESVYKTGTRFCSNKCKYIFLYKLKKENHPRWKGGITNINQKERNSKEYNEWRLSIYKRDYYSCQSCGLKDKKLNAHHIENWSGNESLRLSIDNGITLCYECHNLFHKIYGYKTNKKQLNEFLNSKD